MSTSWTTVRTLVATAYSQSMSGTAPYFYLNASRSQARPYAVGSKLDEREDLSGFGVSIEGVPFQITVFTAEGTPTAGEAITESIKTLFMRLQLASDAYIAWTNTPPPIPDPGPNGGYIHPVRFLITYRSQ